MSTPIPSIDSLSPEDIRVMCAEKLGWKRHETAFGEEWEDLTGNRGTVAATGEHEEYWVYPPDYPGSADAALTLCAWMEEKHDRYAEVWKHPVIKVWSCRFCHEVRIPSSHAESPAFPMAIARAFLLAQGLAQ